MNKLLLILLLLPVASIAQTQEEQILQQVRDREHARQSALMSIMDQGVDSMNAENYSAAEKLFKQVLKQSKVVPTDLCFYFGKNSYYLNKFQQSRDWLNKYIEIKGTSGRFYQESTELLEKSNKEYLKVRAKDREKAEQTILSSSYEVDCGPSGKVVCPVCQGQGVIIQQGPFGNTYKQCPYSDDHGFLTCEEYNQLLRGELEAKY